VSDDGGHDVPLVLMLHGFGVSRYFWNAQVLAVADVSYFAVTPNQRGYAAGARPDPAERATSTLQLNDRRTVRAPLVFPVTWVLAIPSRCRSSMTSRRPNQ
jgi:pimeloyl-ACP methyl ester carboxylesterase